MLSRLTLTFLLFTATLLVWSQDLTAFNSSRLDLNKNGMLVLGSWAILNIATSPFLSGRASGSTRYFHQMNGYWNIVNLTIAGFGFKLALTDPSQFTINQTLKKQHFIESILLLNTGLDIAYIMGGLYLLEKSRTTPKNSERLKGFGQSIILQGAFLFSFDLVFYLFHKSNGSKLTTIFDHLILSSNQIGYSYHF